MAQSTEAAGRELAAIGRRFKEMGDSGNEHKKLLVKGLREGVKQAIPDIRQSALDMLPGGSAGYDQSVADSKFAARTRLSGKVASVKIVGAGKAQIKDTNDRGRLRHPVFGNRNVWVNQAVDPGWFDKPTEAQTPRIHSAIEDVMKEARDYLEAN